MEQVRKHLILKFNTAEGKELKLSVLKPSDGLDPLDTIISSGAYGQS